MQVEEVVNLYPKYLAFIFKFWGKQIVEQINNNYDRDLKSLGSGLDEDVRDTELLSDLNKDNIKAEVKEVDKPNDEEDASKETVDEAEAIATKSGAQYEFLKA